MEPAKANNLVIFITWWRIEVGSDCAVNEIPETFASMGFGFEVIKMYVLSCALHVKCFTEENVMESGDYDVESPSLVWYPLYQDYSFFTSDFPRIPLMEVI